MNFRTFHLLVGALGLLLFILQGQYMARVIGLETLPDGERMLYRSAHIYLMLACLANVAVGYFMTPGRGATVLQRVVSVALLACPFLLIVSFLTESATGSLDRPIATMALYLLFGSSALLLIDETSTWLRSKPGR